MKAILFILLVAVPNSESTLIYGTAVQQSGSLMSISSDWRPLVINGPTGDGPAEVAIGYRESCDCPPHPLSTMPPGIMIMPDPWPMCHYKAILFYHQSALDAYLAEHDVDGATVIDVRQGKEYVIHQKPITETVVEKKVITKGYRSTLDAAPKDR